MIHAERTITVRTGTSIINAPIFLYRGDREVETTFEIFEHKFKFSNAVNLIQSANATYGQLARTNPDGSCAFSDINKCIEGRVVFVTTKDMIDEIGEVGTYSFHIRLYDEEMNSRITIPPVIDGVIIEEPIGSEDTTDVSDIALVDYAVIREKEAEVLEPFEEDGEYIQTEWATGDGITAPKLNKIEEAIDVVNAKTNTIVRAGYATMGYVDNAIDNVSVDLSDYAKTSDIPTKISDLTNDSDFAYESDMDARINDCQTKEDTSLQTINKTTVGAINEFFQSGVNVKQDLVDALIAKDLEVSTSNSFDELISSLNDMPNVKFAHGTIHAKD